MISGCGADFLINICLTILGYFPGHIHAFYLEYVYFDRREKARLGQLTAKRAPGVYSERIQTGGHAHVAVPVNQGYPVNANAPPPGYGTVQ